MRRMLARRASVGMTAAPVNIGPITARILRHYRAAAPHEIDRGREWYAECRAVCEALSAGTSYSLETAAAVFAILSPRISYQQNIDAAAAVLAAHAAGAGPDAVVIPALGANTRKAFAILQGADNGRPARVSGPKVSAFWRAILGDTDAVTLDVWAYRAAVARDIVTRVSERAAVLEAYRRAAAAVGESPRDLQAIVWCHVRGAHD